jgi:uncharacterized membrane-anchored protein YhcB (DUF1043 family)
MLFANIIIAVVTLLTGIIGFLVVRLLNSISNDINELKESMKESLKITTDHETRLTVLEHEHANCFYPRGYVKSSGT